MRLVKGQCRITMILDLGSCMPAVSFYLTAFRSDGSAKSYRAQTLIELLSAWHGEDRGRCTGVVDAGFFDSQLTAQAPAAAQMGQLYLTPNAAGLFQQLFRIDDSEDLQIQGIPLWRLETSLTGCLDPLTPENATIQTEPQSNDWLDQFAASDRAAASCILALGIVTDESYARKEMLLPPDLRKDIGVFRFNHLFTSSPDLGPLGLLHISPPWFLSRKIETLSLGVRLSNILANENIRIVQDLLSYSDTALLSLRGFGARCMSELRLAIIEAVSGRAVSPAPGPGPVHRPESNAEVLPSITDIKADQPPRMPLFDQAFSQAMDRLTFAEQDAIRKRSGLRNGRVLTLLEVASSMGTTKARARSTERKAVRMLCNTGLLEDVEGQLISLMAQKSGPVSVTDLAASEYFASSTSLAAVPYIVETAPSSSIHVISVSPYRPRLMARITQREWNDLARRARQMVGAMVGFRSSACRSALADIVPRDHLGLVDLLWDQISPALLFARGQDDPILLSHSCHLDSIIETLISRLSAPEHFSWFQESIANLSSEEPDKSAITAALSRQAVHFGGGMYGSPTHIQLSSSDRRNLVLEIERVVSTGLKGAWTTANILEVLQCKQAGLRLDLPVLEHLIKSTELIRNEQDTRWYHPQTSIKSCTDAGFVLAYVLQNSGRPLTKAEVRRRLSSLGIDVDERAIAPSQNVIRLDNGRLGLMHRDLGIHPDEHPLVLDLMHLTLHFSERGIHCSDWKDLLQQAGYDCFSGEAVAQLASRDPRFHLGNDGSLYLSEWAACDTIPIDDAVIQVLASSRSGIAYETVLHEVEKLIDRSSWFRIHQKLCNYARLDASTYLWHPKA